jgi:Tol biopolymer transport system component
MLQSKATARIPVALLCCSLAALVLVTHASAAFPGHNGKIAFQSYVDGTNEIHRINPDGSHEERLTDRASDQPAPAFSPNGKKIAFVSDRDGNYEIYVMNADGSHQRRLTNNPADDTQPSFSPDGKKLLFASNRRHEPYPGHPSVYVDELFRMRTDGTHLRLLSTKDVWGRGRAAWSPRRNKIVFAAQASRSQGAGIQLWAMRANGTHKRQLTRGKGGRPGSTSSFSPDFSPSGRRIVFIRRGVYSPHIWVMRADGSRQRRLMPAFNRPHWDPVFSPNGKKIAYAEVANGSSKIKVMRADGSHRHQIAGSNAWGPSWGVRP